MFCSVTPAAQEYAFCSKLCSTQTFWGSFLQESAPPGIELLAQQLLCLHWVACTAVACACIELLAPVLYNILAGTALHPSQLLCIIYSYIYYILLYLQHSCTMCPLLSFFPSSKRTLSTAALCTLCSLPCLALFRPNILYWRQRNAPFPISIHRAVLLPTPVNRTLQHWSLPLKSQSRTVLFTASAMHQNAFYSVLHWLAYHSIEVYVAPN